MSLASTLSDGTNTFTQRFGDHTGTEYYCGTPTSAAHPVELLIKSAVDKKDVMRRLFQLRYPTLDPVAEVATSKFATVNLTVSYEQGDDSSGFDAAVLGTIMLLKLLSNATTIDAVVTSAMNGEQ